MFGYVRPRKDQMKICDYERYKKAYCTVCKALGKNFGFASRFLVNYDMTFLYFLLSCGNREACTEKCACPANVFCKKDCYCAGEREKLMAAMNVILCRNQMDDAVRDKSFFKGLPYRMAQLLIRRGYKKAAALCPDFAKLTADQLSRLAELEREDCASIDETADTFACILKGCAALYSDPLQRRPAEQILYHVGRFLYLTDALDDLQDDCKKSQYNPLRYRFSVQDGALAEEDLQLLRVTMEQSISLAGAALELLPMRSCEEILKNIIYLGLPAVLQAVSEGKFRTRAKI